MSAGVSTAGDARCTGSLVGVVPCPPGADIGSWCSIAGNLSSLDSVGGSTGESSTVEPWLSLLVSIPSGGEGIVPAGGEIRFFPYTPRFLVPSLLLVT